MFVLKNNLKLTHTCGISACILKLHRKIQCIRTTVYL